MEQIDNKSVVGGLLYIFISDLQGLLVSIKWFSLLALIIIIADLRFGVKASKKRGETVRFSRAIRRTGDKIVSYTVWLLLATVAGKSFNLWGLEHFIQHTVLLIIFGTEINSIFSNYFEYRGIKYKFDFFKLFKDKIGNSFEKKEDNKNK